MGFGRSFLYHQTFPKGKIFENEGDFNEALQDGWVEAPWLVDSNPETEELKPWQKALAAKKAKREAKDNPNPI